MKKLITILFLSPSLMFSQFVTSSGYKATLSENYPTFNLGYQFNRFEASAFYFHHTSNVVGLEAQYYLNPVDRWVDLSVMMQGAYRNEKVDFTLPKINITRYFLPRFSGNLIVGWVSLEVRARFLLTPYE